MDKNEILEFVNKEKMATGVVADISNKVGIRPMYLRAGLVAFTVANPLFGAVAYGAGFAYKKYKE